jgi:predicted nucleic acid-binding protein
MPEASPTRVVADADVLAADLLCGDGPARTALDHVRRHTWMTLVASDPLLDDAQAVIEALSEPSLAADWRDRIGAERERIEHPAGDHPALASAYRGGAAHLLSYDEGLRSAETGAALQSHMQVSVRPPDAFARLFDPASLYAAVEGGEYPGPDRDPRS